jgi:hypothetical protein
VHTSFASISQFLRSLKLLWMDCLTLYGYSCTTYRYSTTIYQYLRGSAVSSKLYGYLYQVQGTKVETRKRVRVNSTLVLLHDPNPGSFFFRNLLLACSAALRVVEASLQALTRSSGQRFFARSMTAFNVHRITL